MITLSVEGLSLEERERINATENKQRKLHDLLRGKGLVTPIEEKSLDCQTYLDFKRYWEKVPQKASSDFQSKHQQGWKKSTRKIQAFVTSAHEFMRDLNPIVEFVRGTGGPYGALAIGTISCLFAVARNKSFTEDSISSAMLNVKDRLVGFNMYQDEISDQDGELERELRKQLLLAYVGFLDLAMEGTRYYLRSGFGRLSTAVWTPKKFSELGKDAERAITAVRKCAEELLFQNVNSLKRYNKELKEEVERLRAQDNEEVLSKFKDLLGLSKWTLQSRLDQLTQYKAQIERESAHDHPWFETMFNTDVSKYQQTDAFMEWESPGKSSMLFIIGEKHYDIEQPRAYCWISPLVLHTLDNMQKSAVHAFYTFDVLKRTGLHKFAPEILFQLLRWKKQALGGNNSLEGLYAKMSKYRGIDAKRVEEKTEALNDVVSDVMELFKPGETVYIFLDRIDRCQEEDQDRLLDLLLDAMENAECCLKILVVASTPCWEVSERKIRGLKKGRYNQVTERQKMRQRL